MSSAPVIIGLYSPSPGHGKTTVANYIRGKGFQVISFADPLRGMVYSLLVDLGLQPTEAWSAITTNKNVVIPALGMTGRHLLRTLGTEWGRDLICNDLWLRSWSARIAGLSYVVTDDVRFPNEADLIRQAGGQLWIVTSEREGFAPVDANHRSDGALLDYAFDYGICNDGSLGELYEQVDEALSAIRLPAAVAA
jgi:hypothetical protein